MRKGSNSISAQVSRTARRVSAVLAPQLTKLDFVPCLQITNRVLVRIVDIKKLQSALENYILHNATIFDPIDFEILADRHPTTLRAQLSAEELVVFDGQKRLTSITFADIESANDGPIAAKIRHPLSGMKMFEIMDLAHNGNWQIISSTDEFSKCQIDSMTSFFHQLISLCSLTFMPNWWIVRCQANNLGQIQSQNSLFKENAIVITWNNQADNEMRVLMLCFGMVQMITKGYPQIMTVIKEYRIKKNTT